MKKLLALLLCLMIPVAAFAEPFRVFDNAGLFSPEEEKMLEKAIQDYIWETKTDFAILTTDDFLGGDSQLVIASEFYDAMGFGITRQKDGMIFYIDMCNRAPAISTFGSVISLMTQDNLDAVFDAAHTLLGDGKYYEAMQAVIKKSLEIYTDYWLSQMPQQLTP